MKAAFAVALIVLEWGLKSDENLLLFVPLILSGIFSLCS